MRLRPLCLALAAAALAGCAATEAPKAAADPTLNPLGVAEVTPDEAKSLVPPDLEAERAAIPGTAADGTPDFALPASAGENTGGRLVFGIDPYANVSRADLPVRELAAFNEAVAGELRALTRFGIREVFVAAPAAGTTHLLKWQAALTREGESIGCTLTVTLADVAGKVAVAQESLALRAGLPAADAPLAPTLRALGRQAGLRIVAALCARFPYQAAIVSSEGSARFGLEGGALQGVYEGMQFLVYAEAEGGLLVPLAYADAKPGTTRTDLSVWARNEGDPVARAILAALEDDPAASAAFALRAVCVGNPISPALRRRLAE